MPWMIRLAEVTPAGAGGGGVLLDAGVAHHARRRVWMNGLPHPRPARRRRRAAHYAVVAHRHTEWRESATRTGLA